MEAVGISQLADPPNMGFDEAAMAAAHQFEFEPAELDGKPVAVQITYRYKFTLAPKEKPKPRPAPAAPPAEPKPAPAASEPSAQELPGVVNLRGVVRERGTRLPMPGRESTSIRAPCDRTAA